MASSPDRRGNAELDKKIQDKADQLAKMRKQLENTGNKANGEILIGEMNEVKAEIEKLKAQRK